MYVHVHMSDQIDWFILRDEGGYVCEVDTNMTSIDLWIDWLIGELVVIYMV